MGTHWGQPESGTVRLWSAAWCSPFRGQCGHTRRHAHTEATPPLPACTSGNVTPLVGQGSKFRYDQDDLKEKNAKFNFYPTKGQKNWKMYRLLSNQKTSNWNWYKYRWILNWACLIIKRELLLTLFINWLHVPRAQSLGLPVIPATKYRTTQNNPHTHHTYTCVWKIKTLTWNCTYWSLFEFLMFKVNFVFIQPNICNGHSNDRVVHF